MNVMISFVLSEVERHEVESASIYLCLRAGASVAQREEPVSKSKPPRTL